MKSLHLPNFLHPFPEEIRRQLATVYRLLRRDYSARCMIVGGAVRDRLLGRRVEDLDLEIYDLDPERFAEAMQRIGASGVGKSFLVYKWKSLDIALARTERKVAAGHRGFAVEPAHDAREASRRRDFTVNALLYDLQNQSVVDYWGGLEDLHQHRLRCVDPRSFVEDSLRVLRAMRFAAQLAFRVEEGTCRLCREIALDDLPGSRIFAEFERLFESGYPHYGLYELLRLRIAERLWAEGMHDEKFVAAARRMVRFGAEAPETLKPLCFLEVYRRYSTVPVERILEAIDAPKRWRRLFEDLPVLPERVTPAFVAARARKTGLAESPLGCDPRIRQLAKRLGVWDRAFDPGVTPAELMDRGFRGRELGEELERIRREKLRRLDEKAESKGRG